MSELKNSLREENELLLEQLEQMQDEIEKKDIMIADLQRQRRTSENFSAVSMLKNKVGEQSEEIVRLNGMVESLNEWIGRMSESDLIVKENEQLKQRNRQLENEGLHIRREAETTVRACKKGAEVAVAAAREREENAKTKEQYYNQLIRKEKGKIDERAKKKVSDKIAYLEKQYKATVGAYRTFWSMMLLFSAVSTVLLALKDKVFVTDLLNFTKGMDRAIRAYLSGYVGGAIPAVVTIIGTIFVGGIVVIAGYTYKEFLDTNRIRIRDRTTAVVMFLAMAVVLFAGDRIKVLVGMNLIGVYLMTVVLYVSIRSVGQMKDHEARNRLIVNVLGVIVIVWVLSCALRSCSAAFGEIGV